MAEKRDRDAYEAELTVKLRSIGFSLERTLFGSWVAFHPLGDKIKLKSLDEVEALYTRQTSSGRGFKRQAPGSVEPPVVEAFDSGWQVSGDALERTLGERRGEERLWSLGLHYRVAWLAPDRAADGEAPSLDAALIPLVRGEVQEFLFIEHLPALPVGEGVLALLVTGDAPWSLLVKVGQAEGLTRIEPLREIDQARLAEVLAEASEGDWLLASGDGKLLARLPWKPDDGFGALRVELRGRIAPA